MRYIYLILGFYLCSIGCKKDESGYNIEGTYVCSGYIEEYNGSNYRDTSNVIQKVRKIGDYIEISDNVMYSNLLKQNPNLLYYRLKDTLEYIRTEGNRVYYENIKSSSSHSLKCYFFSDTMLLNYYYPHLRNPYYTYILGGIKRK
jgi:hypothetical protein